MNYVYQSRCECGKEIFLSQERAVFAAVQTSAFYGQTMLAYNCRIHDRFWHLSRATRKKDIKNFKWETEVRWRKKRSKQARQE